MRGHIYEQWDGDTANALEAECAGRHELEAEQEEQRRQEADLRASLAAENERRAKHLEQQTLAAQAQLAENFATLFRVAP